MCPILADVQWRAHFHSTSAVETACPLSKSHATPATIRSTSVEHMAAGNSWPFERAGEDEIAIVVTGRWTNYQVSFTWMGEIEALHLACAFDMRVPELRLAEVQQLIALINEQLWIGHFDVWMQNGVVMFRHALLLAGGAPLRAANARRCSAPRSIPASAISRHSNSWSGRASRRAKRWTPPCSRPPARRSAANGDMISP